jgi:hypothetical protein
VAPIVIMLGNAVKASKKSINVLGVIFDIKLNWSEQLVNTVMKANKSLEAIQLLRKFISIY